jgi:hypothetical protein
LFLLLGAIVELHSYTPEFVHALQVIVGNCRDIIEIQFEAKIGTVGMFYTSKDFHFRFTLNRSSTVFTPFATVHTSPPLKIVISA